MPPKNRSKQQASRTPAPPAAQTPDPAPTITQPQKPWVELVTLPMLLLTLAAASSPISQATLAPVFGALPSAINHQPAVIATALLGFFLRSALPRPPAGRVGSFLAVWAFWIPVVSSYLFRYSSVLGPVGGPIMLGLLSCHCVIVPATYSAAEALEKLNFHVKFGHYAAPVIAASLGTFHLVSFERQFSWLLPSLELMSQIFTPVKLQLLIASTFAYLSPSKLSLLVFPAMIHTFLANPHFDSSRTMDVLNTSLAQHNWTILDRRWSNTGYISVLESLDMHHRVMRCDHSLLGGEWLLTDERKEKEGWKVEEPIYSVFEMLEAVRLIEDPALPPDREAQALVVGLGIGTAPKALIAHGINTTIIEIDPIVHEYATSYFSLPTTHTFVNQDAVLWAASQVDSVAPGQNPDRYDYIIHDVFTGGAEPLSLFTETFIRDLRALLYPRGVIAINYAGDVKFPLTTKVLDTILLVFNGQCRIFRDTPEPLSDRDSGTNASSINGDFTNIIVFCRNAPGVFTFRKPQKADFLGSKSREHYMLPDPALEMHLPQRLRSREDALQIGEEATWSKQQAESAIKHWFVMREVMPNAVWELW